MVFQFVRAVDELQQDRGVDEWKPAGRVSRHLPARAAELVQPQREPVGGDKRRGKSSAGSFRGVSRSDTAGGHAPYVAAGGRWGAVSAAERCLFAAELEPVQEHVCKYASWDGTSGTDEPVMDRIQWCERVRILGGRHQRPAQ